MPVCCVLPTACCLEAALKPFPGFRQELFDKLYDFFHRYFSPSGSIYFQHTPAHKNIYEKVYTDDRDVVLFWKTNMLYYVKTDRLFNSLEVEVDDRKFFFDASTLEHKRSNEKRELVYEFTSKREDGALVFATAYSEKGRKTKLDDIMRQLHKLGVEVKEEAVERAFRVFERQSEVDYFINKNAKAFLREQFDLWLFQYVFSGESEWTEQRIKQLQVLKDIALKVINFISQFEDELVSIWNKPKFVLNSNYVITLDRIAAKDIGLVERLLKHDGMKAQIQEWRDLGIVGDDFRKTQILDSELDGKVPAKQWRFLPFDTKHFKDLELEILGLFDHLDDELDGWLIKSENYQALETLMSRFQHRVQCIFIDPPYNTGNDEFAYVDVYRHASWLSMVADRTGLARHLLDDRGALFVTIDDIEAPRLRLMLDALFGEDNFIANIVWQKKQSPQNDAVNLSDMHDHVLLYAKRAKSSRDDPRGWQRSFFARGEEQESRYSNPDNDPRGVWSSGDATCNKTADERPNLYYSVTNPYTKKAVWPTKRRVWLFEKAEFEKFIKDNRVWWGDDHLNFPRVKKFRTEVAEGIVPSTWWPREEAGDNQEARRELRCLFVDEPRSAITPKPSRLIRRIVGLAGGDESIVLDYFAGTGTTASAVMQQNSSDGGHRKYVLVEMDDSFDDIILPRVKKLAFCSDWKDGKAEGGKGISHFVKYFQLEQYEDCLRRAKYEEADLFDDPYQDPYNQYVFLRDRKLLDAVKVDTKKNKVQVDSSRLYKGIDLPETLSNLTGKRIRRVKPDSVEFEDGTVIDLTKQDFEFFKLIRPMVWW
ncbi:MAG: site-specific DNA-methyltransferase [candidate division WOR-3 bacterium]|nr:site-specific DNA-methyltransferase [candidate division WOR-3 bacterium]